MQKCHLFFRRQPGGEARGILFPLRLGPGDKQARIEGGLVTRVCKLAPVPGIQRRITRKRREGLPGGTTGVQRR